MCKAFGINGKTGGQYEGEQTVDASRQVRVQFLTTNFGRHVLGLLPQEPMS